MDNRVNFANYKQSHNFEDNTDKLEAIVFNLDLGMKKLHKNGEVVTSFDPRSISVCWTNNNDVYYTRHQQMGNLTVDQVLECKKNNIESQAVLLFCALLPDYGLDNGLLNHQVVKEKYKDFSYLFNKRDNEYFNTVFQEENPIYYSDFLTKQSQLSSEEYTSSESGVRNVLVKSTSQGKYYEDGPALGNAAQTNVFLLTVFTAIGFILTVASLAYLWIQIF